MTPQDAALAADLELQAQRLTALLVRYRAALEGLVPSPSMSWRGPARVGFDLAIDELRRTMQAGIDALGAARDHSLSAARTVAARG